MIAVGQRQPAILEGELLGNIPEMRVSAAGCPGIAASSPIPLIEQERAAGHHRA